jgi:2-C-methyl-D-erythritol 4-phosphate cytidylyltransferase
MLQVLGLLTKDMGCVHTKIVAIIPAAGSGVRMGGRQAKQFLDLDGRPLLAVTLKAFQDCRPVDAVIVVVPPKAVDYCQGEIVDRFGLDKVEKILPGGERRQDSVRLGIEASGGAYETVLIHDGVRPLIGAALIERLIEAASTHRAVIAGLPAQDTVKAVNDRREVVKTYDRGHVWLVQTPQICRYQDILLAHQRALQERWEEAPDDSVLIERVGVPVQMVEGDKRNIKVTTPYELELARFLTARKDFPG